jgi:hypothetical protein
MRIKRENGEFEEINLGQRSATDKDESMKEEGQ